jgi:predicted Co/Zn/Cd cation transporter (cation efflux family)
MDDQPGLSDQYRMSSPWPVFVTLGLVISELGIFFGIVPLAVGGLLLLTGSIAGIIREAGYTEQPWGTLGMLGVVLVVLGGILIATQIPAATVNALSSVLTGIFSARPNGIVVRGVSIVFAGVIAFAVSQTIQYVSPDADAL